MVFQWFLIEVRPSKCSTGDETIQEELERRICEVKSKKLLLSIVTVKKSSESSMETRVEVEAERRSEHTFPASMSPFR